MSERTLTVVLRVLDRDRPIGRDIEPVRVVPAIRVPVRFKHTFSVYRYLCPRPGRATYSYRR
jgi:hypothetical protein